MLRLLARFGKEDHGYAIALTLVAMPLILGISLFVIDGSRVANLNTDLANAVDSMALAGARELDGRADAIGRAKSAIATLVHNNSAFGGGGVGAGLGSRLNVTYDPASDANSTVLVKFLKTIPANDDDPIRSSDLTSDSTLAKYVWVITKPQAVNLLFPISVMPSINTGAASIATYTAAACDVTPLWICNPYEGAGKSINQAYSEGLLYGKQITMEFSGSSTPFPGNFGLLAVGAKGGNALGDALATGNPEACYTQEGVETEPGATWGKVKNGINVRMDLYAGDFKGTDTDPLYRPAENSRKGAAVQSPANKQCTNFDPETDKRLAMGFPESDDGASSLPGGAISNSSDWNLRDYWYVNHSGDNPNGFDTTSPDSPSYNNPSWTPPSPPISDIQTKMDGKSSYPTKSIPDGVTPSRYDVYRYELAQSLEGDTAPNGDTGTPQCGWEDTSGTYSDDRRNIFAAVVNCNWAEANGGVQGRDDLPIEAYVSMFMTQPAIGNETGTGPKRLFFEITDVSGAGGRGTLEDFLREDAEIVRVNDFSTSG